MSNKVLLPILAGLFGLLFPNTHSRSGLIPGRCFQQQERTPITLDAVAETTFNLPFIVAKILILP